MADALQWEYAAELTRSSHCHTEPALGHTEPALDPLSLPLVTLSLPLVTPIHILVTQPALGHTDPRISHTACPRSTARCTARARLSGEESASALPMQIALELHTNTLDSRGYYSHTGRRMTTLGEIALLAALWHSRGYVLISREDNRLAARANRFADSTELTLLRVRCPSTTSRQPAQGQAQEALDVDASSATQEGTRHPGPAPMARRRPAARTQPAKNATGQDLVTAVRQTTPLEDNAEPLLVEGAGVPSADGVYGRVRAANASAGRQVYAHANGCRIFFSDGRTTPHRGWQLRCADQSLYVTRRCYREDPTLCGSWKAHHPSHSPAPTIMYQSTATAPISTASPIAAGTRRVVWPLSPAAVPADHLASLPVGRPLRRRCTGGPRVTVFTFVKDEVDIVSAWVHYHASLFGYTRLHVVDNNSTDGTLEVLAHLASLHGVRLYGAADYQLKGEVMTRLMRQHTSSSDLLIPLDIDEFVVRYDQNDESSGHVDVVGGTRSGKRQGVHRHARGAAGEAKPRPEAISVDGVCSYLRQLPLNSTAYKMNYLIPAVEHDGGYRDAPREAAHAHLSRGVLHRWRLAKTFFSAHLPIPLLDHGSHMGQLGASALITSLCLVHFHTRSEEQVNHYARAVWVHAAYPRRLIPFDFHYKSPSLFQRPAIFASNG